MSCSVSPWPHQRRRYRHTAALALVGSAGSGLDEPNGAFTRRPRSAALPNILVSDTRIGIQPPNRARGGLANGGTDLALEGLSFIVGPKPEKKANDGLLPSRT